MRTVGVSQDGGGDDNENGEGRREERGRKWWWWRRIRRHRRHDTDLVCPLGLGERRLPLVGQSAYCRLVRLGCRRLMAHQLIAVVFFQRRLRRGGWWLVVGGWGVNLDGL